MSASPETPKKTKARRVNVRRPEVMERVQAEVQDHYKSEIVEKVRSEGGILTIGNTTIRLAKQFGFCYGVERAIDLAYAARKVFPDSKLYLIGEIIHNPEVNRQLADMGILNLAGPNRDASISDLTADDIVIVPAFGAEVSVMERIQERGCITIDTTCGDVMSVWKRIRKYRKDSRTSIIHGKANHEETLATASRALGEKGKGHYLVLLTLEDVDYVCDYIKNGGDRDEFLEKYGASASEGFDPDLHLVSIGIANQTTMLKSETEEFQKRIEQAIIDRDGADKAKESFSAFDTICGATQERQDALFEMLDRKMDILLVVGGYNSSNTTHLVEIGGEHLPSFFIRNSDCLKSLEEITHFDLEQQKEVSDYTKLLSSDEETVIGVTAGASCPNNLIEETILKVFELRGIDKDKVLVA